MADWILIHRRTALLAGSIAFALVGLVVLVGALGSTGSGPTAAQVTSELREDLISEQQGLYDDHRTLMREVGTVDADRVDRDTAIGRSLVLSLAATSGSSLDLAHQQVVLNNRYEFLEKDSPVLVTFLPEWMAATRTSGPITYSLTGLDIQVTGVSSLTYHHTGVARLDPVGGEGDPQYLLVRYVTEQDGSVTSLSAARATNSSRDELSKDERYPFTARPQEPESERESEGDGDAPGTEGTEGHSPSPDDTEKDDDE